jgi:hypothetical protein
VSFNCKAGQRFRHAARQEFGNLGVPDDLDVRIGKKAVLQDLFSTQRITAMDQGNVLAVVGHVDGFLDGGVAAADHRHLLAAIEEAVAGGTG